MKKLVIVIIALILGTVKVEAMISGEACCVISADSAEVIYEKNSDSLLPMASTTKILTGLLAIERNTPDEAVKVSANADGQIGSSIYIESGSEVKLEDLIYGLLLNSGNDAAVAIAEHISGSSESFALEMTERARELGCENTTFKNPSGLDEDGHQTTAYDLALIGRAAMTNSEFAKVVGTKYRTIHQNDSDTYLKNHNKLLWSDIGVIGVKTGYTKKSGRCLVTAAERNGVRLICVTLNCPNDWQDHKNLYEYCFNQVERKTVLTPEAVLKRMKADGEEVEISAGSDFSYVTNSSIRPEVVLHLPKKLTAPINTGEKLGYAEVYCGRFLVGTVDLVAMNSVYKSEEKPTFFRMVLENLRIL